MRSTKYNIIGEKERGGTDILLLKFRFRFDAVMDTNVTSDVQNLKIIPEPNMRFILRGFKVYDTIFGLVTFKHFIQI